MRGAHLLAELLEPLLKLLILANAGEGALACKGVGELVKTLDDLRPHRFPQALLLVEESLVNAAKEVLELGGGATGR